MGVVAVDGGEAMAPALPLRARRLAKNVVYMRMEATNSCTIKVEARVEDWLTHETFSHNGIVIVTWYRGA
jgi:hypothetical protein